MRVANDVTRPVPFDRKTTEALVDTTSGCNNIELNSEKPGRLAVAGPSNISINIDNADTTAASGGRGDA